MYDHFGGRERFQRISENMMLAVDKADSAKFSADEIENPQGWALLSFLMDATNFSLQFNLRIMTILLLLKDVVDCFR